MLIPLDDVRAGMQIIPAALLHLGIGNYAGAYWNLYLADFFGREEGIVKEAGLTSNEGRPVALRNKGCLVLGRCRRVRDTILLSEFCATTSRAF